MTVDQLKEAIVCRVQHELRTPVTIASMAYELLCRPEADAARDAQMKELLGRALKKLEEHLANLSVLSACGDGAAAPWRSPTDLAALAAAAVEDLGPLAGERQVSVELAVSGVRRPLALDGGLVRVAVRNVLQNAVRFNRPGGRVRLALRYVPAGACVRVSDDGIGVGREDLALALGGFHQAESFLRRREGGIGIGLAAARRVAEAHGGRLAVSSRPGRGTALTMTFPEGRHGA